MARFKIEAGNRFIHEGSEVLVVKLEKNTHILLERIEDGERNLVGRFGFERDILAGTTILIQISENQNPIYATPLDLMTIEQKEVVSKREAYVKALMKETVSLSIRSCWEEVVHKVAGEIGDNDPPKRATLCRWYKRWIESGRSPASLVPQTDQRGASKSVMTQDVQNLVFDLLDKHYLTREQLTLDDALTAYVFPELQKINETRPSDDQFQIPSRATIFRYVDSLDKYYVTLKREGQHAADKQYRYAGASIKVEAPLDLVLFDHTVVDVQLIAPIDGFVARPTITVALDLYSRMVWGVYIGFAPPSYETVMLVLKNGISPKAYQAVDGEYPCYGVPRAILLDNAMEFHSNNLIDVARTLNIDIVYHPVRSPHYKGAVERFFRSMNDGLLAGLKGRTFSNVQKKGDYDSVKNAAIPFKVFQEALHKWIVDVYARKFQHGIKDFPIERWQRGVEKFPVDLPVNMDDLKILLGSTQMRKLQRTGLYLHNTRYTSEALHKMYVKVGHSHEIKVKIDPFDLGKVFIFDNETKKYIEATAVDDDYSGLSLHEYKLIRAEIIRRKKAGEFTYNIGEQRRKILEIANTSEPKKKRRSNKKAARTQEANLRSEHGSKQKKNIPIIVDNGPSKNLAKKLRQAARRNGWRSENE